MRSLNRVFLVGNVGKDPEIRSTATGSVVANLSLATQYRHKDTSEKWVETPEWHNLVAFGKTAEVIRDYVRKGSPIHVEGRIQTRSYNDKEGVKQYRTEIVIEDLILLGSKDQGSQNQPKPEIIPIPEDDSIPF